MNLKSNAIASLLISSLILPATAQAQTLWKGESGGEWSVADNWDSGVPGPDKMARITTKQSTQIEVKSPAVVQGIEVNGKSEMVLDGESITLGNGCGGTFNSILVNGGDVIINNKLINTQNKRITLNQTGHSLTLNGNIETGNQTTQIGNLGDGVLTLNGDRSGGNSLVIRDGIVVANGILSNTGGGGTQVMEGGVLIAARKVGLSIQAGSFGLAIREKGIFRLGAANQIGSFLNFAGGKLDMGGFSNEMPVIGNAAVSANSVIDFSHAEAESLAIADVSKNTNWKPGATLQIVGFSRGDSLRFGDNAQGLTEAQLAAIKFDDKPAQIDKDGYVTPKP